MIACVCGGFVEFGIWLFFGGSALVASFLGLFKFKWGSNGG